MPQSQVLQNSKTDSVTTKSINFNGRQITNAGNAINPQDYVTLSQMQFAITAAIPTTTTNRTQININGIVKAGQPGAVLFVGAQGQLSQDSANFKYDQGNTKLLLSNLNISTLTVSKPTKTDASKNLISGLIVLTTDVSGVLPVVNGGQGLATLTAHAVMLGNGTGTVGFATIGTAGKVLTDNGAGADPTFQVPSATGVISFNTRTGAVTLVVGDINGLSPTFNATTSGTLAMLGQITLNTIQFSVGNTTGAGSVLLGANSPATILTAPYKWFTVLAADGTTVFIPAWK